MSYTRALGLTRTLGIPGLQARLGGQPFFIVVWVAPNKSHDSPKHIQANCLPTVRDGVLGFGYRQRFTNVYFQRGSDSVSPIERIPEYPKQTAPPPPLVASLYHLPASINMGLFYRKPIHRCWSQRS